MTSIYWNSISYIIIFFFQGQDDHLLDSPSCVRFLLKLLNPSSVGNVEGKSPTIGCKLLALNRDIGMLRSSTKKLDSSFTAIILKVQEILLSCKELKPRNTDGEGTRRPELSPKWIALLTMEKACLSTISLEGRTCGTYLRLFDLEYALSWTLQN